MLQVKWMTFHFTASKLAGNLERLYGAINEVLPYLPNAAMKVHSSYSANLLFLCLQNVCTSVLNLGIS